MFINEKTRLKKFIKALEKAGIPVPYATFEDHNCRLTAPNARITIWAEEPRFSKPLFDDDTKWFDKDLFDSKVIAMFCDAEGAKFEIGKKQIIISGKSMPEEKPTMTPLAALRLVSAVAKELGIKHSYAGFYLETLGEESKTAVPVINLFASKPEFREGGYDLEPVDFFSSTLGWLTAKGKNVTTDNVAYFQPCLFLNLEPAVSPNNIKDLMINC